LDQAILTAPAAERSGASPVASWFIGFISIYLALQVVLRLSALSSLNIDDADMIVTTQVFAPGYGAQPPLYMWMQIPLVELFGLNRATFLVPHYLLLWATFLFMFLSARMVLGDELKAAGVALALFTLPQIGWEFQYAYSHAVLATAMASVTLYVMLLMLRTGSWGAYIALGLCFGLGILSKYSYIPLPFVLLAAAGSIPSLRLRVLSARMAAALGLAALLVVPHVIWAATHMDRALSHASQFRLAHDVGLLQAWGRGLLAATAGIAGFAALTVAVFALAAFLPVRGTGAGYFQEAPDHSGSADERRFILRICVISLVSIPVIVLAARATAISERWLLCVLLVLPLALCILLERRFDRVRQKRLIVLSAGCAIVSLLAFVFIYLFPDVAKKPARAAVPFGALAAEIRHAGFDKGYILADQGYVAGNLKLYFPDSTVAEPAYGLWPIPAGAKAEPVLVVWTGKGSEPVRLRKLRQQLCGSSVGDDMERRQISALYNHSASARYTLTVAVLPSCPALAAEP
jgi:4-amino-4-deoxy-L-arabinose transferase-like glycosyltransferase